MNHTSMSCLDGCACNSTNNCTACISGFFEHRVPSHLSSRVMVRSCVKTCPPSTYPNWDNNTCIPCKSGCDLCSENECFRCAPGNRSHLVGLDTNLTSSLSCLRTCPVRTVSIDDNCVSCPANCLNCTSGSSC